MEVCSTTDPQSRECSEYLANNSAEHLGLETGYLQQYTTAVRDECNSGKMAAMAHPIHYMCEPPRINAHIADSLESSFRHSHIPASKAAPSILTETLTASLPTFSAYLPAHTRSSPCDCGLCRYPPATASWRSPQDCSRRPTFSQSPGRRPCGLFYHLHACKR